MAPLNEPLQRAGPEDRVVAGVGQPAWRRRNHRVRRRAARRCSRARAGCHDLAMSVLGQRPELDDLVDAVQELRLEGVAQVPPVIGRHDQHGVGEIDRPALAVGQAAVVEHLQQDVEDVGVGLFDLVEQHDRVGAPADGLGQLAALLVAHVAGRGADEPGHASASPCTRTCRCAPWPARRRRGSRPAPWPARSCRRRSGRGTGSCRSGRLGSASPLRERRMALATALTASSWPTTRSWRTSSI